MKHLAPHSQHRRRLRIAPFVERLADTFWALERLPDRRAPLEPALAATVRSVLAAGRRLVAPGVPLDPVARREPEFPGEAVVALLALTQAVEASLPPLPKPRDPFYPRHSDRP